MKTKEVKNISWPNQMTFIFDYYNNPTFTYCENSKGHFFGDRLNDILKRSNKPHSAYTDYCFTVLK